MRDHQKYSRTLKVVLALLMCLLLVACGRTTGRQSSNANSTSPTPKPLVVLFLIDPTSSLVEPENDRVATLATTMFKELPENSRYGVYPIQIDADRVPPIIPDDVVPPSFRTDVEKRQYEKERSKLEGVIYSKVKDLYKTDGTVADDRRSCILNMLAFAEKQLKQMSRTQSLDPEKATYRLVIISDMVEECRDSPLGEVRLNKKDISAEIKLADNYTQVTSPPDLSNVHITVIFPLTEKSPPDISRRPTDRDLRAFWEKIFSHCQKQKEGKWSWNPQYIEWVSTGQLPNWFKVLQEEKKENKPDKTLASR